MLFRLRVGFFPLLSIIFLSSSVAQTEQPLQLNGALYEVVTSLDGTSRQSFLWSLELEELSTSYDVVASSVQRKRVNVLFYTEKSGRDWRRFWGERMQLVYSNQPETVNDHAEAFFGITGAFPDAFRAGDEFSLVSEQDGATRAYLNDKLITQTLKPGHFEFWLRAWNTQAPMPDVFKGNLLASGFIPDDLFAAYLNSEPPKPVRTISDQENLSEEVVEADNSSSIDVESVASQGVVPVVPVVLNNGNEASGF